MEVQRIIDECQEFLEIYEGIKLNQPLINDLVSMTNALLTDIATCLTKLIGIEALADASREIKRWQRIIKTFKISKLGSYEAPDAAPASPHNSSPAPEYRGKRDASPNTMNMMRQDLLFFMNKLRDDLLPDVGIGAEISNSELRDLYDATLPQISKVVDECRRTLSNYMSKGNYDRDLASEARQRCEDASNWTSDLIFRHRRNKLHLDKNTKHREITFTKFIPGGGVSIYQFLTSFENWADDYLSEEAKADQLYHRYLDKSITESYAELSSMKESFPAMKNWLIQKYGSAVPIAHDCIKSIQRMPTPNESDICGSAQYLRSIHKLLTSLTELEIAKGVPVPKLQNYLGNNAFLSALIEVLPAYIQMKFFEDLVDEGIDNFDTIEGREHLSSIINLIKKKYRAMELQARACPSSTITSPPPKQQSNPQSKMSANPASNAPYQSTNVTNTPQQNVNPSAPPQSPTYSNAQPPFPDRRERRAHLQRQATVPAAEPVELEPLVVPHQRPPRTQHF
jgi:hypothetical protein